MKIGDKVTVKSGEVFHLCPKYRGKFITMDPLKSKCAQEVYEYDRPGISFGQSVIESWNSMPIDVGPGNLSYGYRRRKMHVYTPVSDVELTVPNTDDWDYTGVLKSYVPIDVKYLGTVYINGDEGLSGENFEWVKRK